MRSVLVIVALSSVACASCAPQEARAPEVVLPPPRVIALAPATRPAAFGAFVGEFQGSLGAIRFAPEDDRLVGVSARTVLSCTGSAELDCTWKSGRDHGWAKLRLDASSNVRGDWGNEGDTEPSGTWLFVRSGGQEGDTFNGTYSSTYGDVALTQHGADVSGAYQNGTLVCTANGPSLTCDWDESGSIGRALLTRQPNGHIVGTWGYQKSDTDGGAWTMEPK